MEFNEEKIRLIKDYLLQHQQTVAVAESVTSGLLQFALSSADDALHFFQGGLTAYNLGQKARQLHIEPIHAARCNCADGKVAAEMAVNVTQLFSSHWGISITGYATPVPESGNQLFAYYAIAQKDKVIASGKMQEGKGTAKEVQLYYVNSVLGAFLKLLG
ncbi:nicotinamide-nucleotide amidohydrolase family protein [Chitinophaga niabensis]|uniref:CinA family protein n=1 Tax=Chitinophaga niabensis TaxID=536979 RepID=UPI0031BA27AE